MAEATAKAILNHLTHRKPLGEPALPSMTEENRKTHCHICLHKRSLRHGLVKCEKCRWRACTKHASKKICLRCQKQRHFINSAGVYVTVDTFENLLQCTEVPVRPGTKIQSISTGQIGTVVGVCKKDVMWQIDGTQHVTEWRDGGRFKVIQPPEFSQWNDGGLLPQSPEPTMEVDSDDDDEDLEPTPPPSPPPAPPVATAPPPYVHPTPSRPSHFDPSITTPALPTAHQPVASTFATSSPTISDLPSPPVIGREDQFGYKREAKLGGGAQGAVYRCVRIRDGAVFAVKDIESATDISMQYMQAKAMKRTLSEGNTHVVKYHDVLYSKYSNNKYILSIVMDYSEGGDLKNLIAGSSYLPETKVLSIACQVMKALMHMHERQVLHMDVKPENILIFGDADNVVAKLTDFDASREMGSGEGSQETTMAYTAPEVLEKKQFTWACDVFSLGVVFFTLATLPSFPLLDDVYFFNDERWKDREALASAISRAFEGKAYEVVDTVEKKMRWYKYSKELIDLITSMVQYNPLHRPTVRDLNKHFEDLFGDLLTGVISGEVTAEYSMD